MDLMRKKFHSKFEPGTSGTPGEALNTAPQMHTCAYGKWSSQQHAFIHIFNSKVWINNLPTQKSSFDPFCVPM